MPQKASTPWSNRSVAEGGTDSPVGSLVPVPDEITPVVNTGFIATTGKFIGLAADDLAFTFQDPFQALAAGASMFINPINMMNRDIIILGLLDSSGNNINVDIMYMLSGTDTGSPYDGANFPANIDSAMDWRSNDPGDGAQGLVPILDDTSEVLKSSWRFYKIAFTRGTVGQLEIRSNEGSNAGTISSAFMRLV